jgi:hypothetical protein
MRSLTLVAEIIKTFLCGLSELGGKKNRLGSYAPQGNYSLDHWQLRKLPYKTPWVKQIFLSKNTCESDRRTVSKSLIPNR